MKAILILMLFACSTTTRGAPAVKTAAIECGKEYAPALVKAVAKWGAAALAAGKIDWPAVEADALALGKEVGSCAVAEFLAAYKASPAPAIRALVPGPSPATEGDAVLARVSGGEEVRLP